ncbi:EF-hand calcium-binding domain-containing protein 6 [Scomber japonicus]|uniref:EF-hand calcium-binding domain-containing protein 6 n=1 Tax=Scomber japonicus TaxID=13676 RepID=UPI002305AD88|nr:EF-hand calcium-binding domain-containing protein 6 [Scomber japonicus]
MSKLLPLQPGLGQLDDGLRPNTVPSTTHSSTGRQTGGRSWQTWIHTDRARPVTPHPGQQLTLASVESLIRGRLPNIKSAFMALDHDGTGLVKKEEFRRVLKRCLSVSQNQLDTLLNEVCKQSGATVNYMWFLRRFSRAPTAHRACSSLSVRRGPQNSSMSLSEIQKHLKDKIGGNLRTVIRVFRLFDYNRGGHIQQHDFRRILDSYLIQLTDKEFHRLWSHYSPNNKVTISYVLFLDKLGFGNSHNFNIAPVCTKLEVSGRQATPPEKVKQRPECIAPSVLPHRKLQTLFYNKMCVNSTPVWQALQAFDTTHSGLVKQEVLRAVLNSFIFPMNTHSFQKLTSRYGVKATGSVRWKHFLGYFMSLGKEEADTDLHTDRTSEQPLQDKDNLDLQDFYPRLKEIFLQDKKEVGWISRADLQHLLKRPGGSQPRNPQPHLHNTQITELLNILDSEHSGVIQLSSLERLNPIIPSAPSPCNTPEPLDEETETVQQKTPDERQTTQWADKVSLASASWITVESLLLEKLCEQLSSVLAALKLCDPQCTGYVKQEDLKRVLSHYGFPISDTHFNKLCGSFSSSTPGSSSRLVSYIDLFRYLGAPLTDESTPSSCYSHTERSSTSPQCTLQSVRAQRGSRDTCSILDIVFKRMRSRLEQRHTSLIHRIQAIIYSCDGTLSEADIRKILEDSWIILDNENFNKFIELLGLIDGRIECQAFQRKYEGEERREDDSQNILTSSSSSVSNPIKATARDGQQDSEGSGEKEVFTLLTSAEQCLAAMKTRIKIIHKDNLTAFRLMDRKRKGVVDCHDFRVLYNSLGFMCQEGEYQRLLHLIGLQPGGNLNYAEFVSVVENKGKHGTQTATIQGQLHDLLACEAHYKWADMCKMLCHCDTDGQGWIDKTSLRELLYTYSLPLTSNEFEQLWLRYDPEGKGSVAVCDFLERLGFNHDVRQGQILKETVVLKDASRPDVSDTTSPQCIEQVLQDNYKELSDALIGLERRGDGTVTVEELLNLFHSCRCFIQREQLINHLHRFKVSMTDNNRRISYMDLLSVLNHKAEKKNEPSPSTPEAIGQIESLNGLSPDTALVRMQELVTASAPNLSKAFSAFDQSSTGTVRALDFRQVLENFCARLSDKQFRHMLTRLELNSENCTVNWKDFLSKFQSQSPVWVWDDLDQAGAQYSAAEYARASAEVRSVEAAAPHFAPVSLQSRLFLDFTLAAVPFRCSLKDRVLSRITPRWNTLETVFPGLGFRRQVLQNWSSLARWTLNLRLVSRVFIIAVAQAGSTFMSERCLSRTRERPKTTSVVQSDTSGVTVVLQQIQEVFSGHLYELTKDVLDLDSSNSSTITKEHFRQLCTGHCPTLTHDQFECVWSQMAVQDQGKLQFREFVKRFGALGRTAHTEAQSPNNRVPSLSPELPASTRYHYTNTAGATLHRSKSASQCSSKHGASAGRPGTGSLPGITERRLRGEVQRCWKDIHKNCSQEDPQQEGHISAVSFLEILQSLNINVSQVQFERLAVKLNIMNAGAVSYHNFLRHFLLNLRPAETRRMFDRCKLPLPVTPMIHGVLSKDCVEVMLRIYEAVRSSWSSIRRSFLTSDRTRTGSVSVQDFRKVLRQFSVSLSEEEFFHLSSYYDANTAGEICYNHFLWAFLH